MQLNLSILDLVPIRPGEGVAEAMAASVSLAQLAERSGYRRVWYAEHHNMATIGSAATSVVIAHVAAHTSQIRLGAGGIMLPNHSPLVIAEQFGTLEALHPGRIDLGLGRAPGTDQRAMLALRRSLDSSSRFAEDVLELQGYLTSRPTVPGVNATPGTGANVPLYILGSSMFGAHLAASLGLPYAFASHFAPEELEPAVTAYRKEFRASSQLGAPYVLAGVNVIAATTASDAEAQFELAKRNRTRALFGRDRALREQDIDAILASPAARRVDEMVMYSAVGTPPAVRKYLEGFARHAQADELITVHQSPAADDRLRSVELLAGAMAVEGDRVP
jgi:luciferase family oxidoreductase group 1